MLVPCLRGSEIEEKAAEIALRLKERAHEVAGAGVGLSEEECFDPGYFRAAIEKIRCQYAATLKEKRVLMRAILNYMQDSRAIEGTMQDTGSSRLHGRAI